MRHIGSLGKLIDYLNTVEFFTLKTSQCKKGNNADSKKYTSSVQCLHRSLIFYILKFYMNFQVTIIGPIRSLRPTWPIRTPERSSRLGGQMRLTFKQVRNIIQKAVIFNSQAWIYERLWFISKRSILNGIL